MVSASGFLGFISSAQAEQKVEKLNFIGQNYSLVVTESGPYNTSAKIVATSNNMSEKTFSDCNFQALFSGKNYFQDQASLNLNQPANCFNLGFGNASPVVKSLEVKNLSNVATKIVVVNLSNSFFAQNLKQSPVTEAGFKAVFVNYTFTSFLKKYALVKPNVDLSLFRIEINNESVISRNSVELQNLLC